jgi:hypothetical protein
MQALRGAFVAAMDEADLRADLARLGLAITPSSGESVAALVARFASVPKRVIEKATAGLHP